MRTTGLLILLVLLAACGRLDERQTLDGSRPVNIVATTSIIADIAQRVAGENGEVTSLMGPGVDPHLYRASEGDVQRMTAADIVFFNGLHLEGRMSELLEEMTEGGIRTAAVTDDIPRDRLFAPPEFEGNYDPHVWMDVGMWQTAVGRIGESLALLDPTHADGYRSRAADLVDELGELDDYVRMRVAEVPEDKRVLVTAHDAFNYFGRAYGFEVRGLQGISTVAEAGTADVQRLAEFVATRRIPAIFVESSVSPRNIEAVRAAVRARSFDVEVGGNLYSDALGGTDSGADTYSGMIQHNVDTMVDALTRDVE